MHSRRLLIKFFVLFIATAGLAGCNAQSYYSQLQGLAASAVTTAQTSPNGQSGAQVLDPGSPLSSPSPLPSSASGNTKIPYTLIPGSSGGSSMLPNSLLPGSSTTPSNPLATAPTGNGDGAQTPTSQPSGTPQQQYQQRCQELLAQMPALKAESLPSAPPVDLDLASGNSDILAYALGKVVGAGENVTIDAITVDTVSAAVDTLKHRKPYMVNEIIAAGDKLTVTVGSLNKVDAASGSVEIVARPVPGVKNQIGSIIASTGDLLICGFDIDEITLAAGNVVIVGGTVDHLVGAAGNVTLTPGTVFQGAAGTIQYYP